MNALAAVVLLSCTALAAAGGFSTSYGPPAYSAPAPAPAPAYSAPAPAPAPVYSAPAPAQQFAPAPAPAPAPAIRVAPGIHSIPVVPFPGFGRAVVHHFADKVNTVANHVVRTVAFAEEAANSLVRGLVEDKRNFLNALVAPGPASAPAPAPYVTSTASASSGLPSTVVFTPESLAVSAPPAGLAPPVREYGAPAAAPAPSSQYSAPSF